MTNPPLPYDIDSNGESLMGDGQGRRVEPTAPVAAYLEGLCIKVMGCDYTPTPEEFGTVLGMAMGREGVEVPAGDPVRGGGARAPRSMSHAAPPQPLSIDALAEAVRNGSLVPPAPFAPGDDISVELATGIINRNELHAPQPDPDLEIAIATFLARVGFSHEAYPDAKRDLVRAFVAWHGAEARGEVGAGDDAAFVERMAEAHTPFEKTVVISWTYQDRLIALARRGARAPVASPFDGHCCTPREGEPFFVLLGRDAQAAGLVEQWAADRERLKPGDDKVSGAKDIAVAMRAYNPASVKDELRAAFNRLRWEAAISAARPRDDPGAVEAAVAEEREAAALFLSSQADLHLELKTASTTEEDAQRLKGMSIALDRAADALRSGNHIRSRATPAGRVEMEG